MSVKQHIPILVETFLSFFSEQILYAFIDGTVGAAGHAYALLEAHPEINQFYGLDRDPEALKIAGEILHPFGKKVKLIHGNFRNMDEWVSEPVQGIFLDLGLSSMQLENPEKGFSLYKVGPLDMRMDPTQGMTAREVVNTFSEKELAKIFYEYGEEPRARKAAKALVMARQKKPLQTTTDLAEALQRVLTWRGRKARRVHPMTLVFQGLRLYVNEELQALEEALLKGVNVLATGGRFGVMSFHSLEDRVVKQMFRRLALENKVKILTKKPLIPDQQEKRKNPRSRSAKMRFVEKL